jgi:LPXTG-motif cell wall-anchored protein
MLEAINEFVSNNSILVLLGLVAVVVLVGFVMFRRSSQQSNNSGMGNSVSVPTPSHDLEGLDNTNMVCDLANGVCIPTHEQNPVELEQPQIQQEHVQQQH